MDAPDSLISYAKEDPHGAFKLGCAQLNLLKHYFSVKHFFKTLSLDFLFLTVPKNLY